MMQEPERPVDHVTGTRGDLGAAAEAGEIVADVAVVLLDREGQILAGEELLRRDQPVKAFPVVGQEDTALDADLVEKSAAGRIITPTQLPGQGSPCQRVVGPPEPNLVFFPFFDPLPARSSGMLPEGDPPFMPCQGVLVDDPGHADDLVAHTSPVYEHVGEPAPGPDILRRSLSREFFTLHLKMYSKSRRKAPIYWQFATPSS